MKFTVQIDRVHYNDKPKKEVTAIKKRLAETIPAEMTAQDFAKAVSGGASFTPAILRGGAKAENWTAQQLFAVDIDNEDKTAPKGVKRRAAEPLTIEEVKRRCTEWDVYPFLIYETFSNSEQWQKFRIVFAANRVITDGAERDCIQQAFMELFPECDPSCKNRDRLFFGGKRAIFFNKSECYFDPAAVLPLGRAAQEQEHAERMLAELDRKNSSPELESLKRSFDLLGYIRQNYSVTEKRSGNYIILNPCPICGHKDDFVFYPQTNSFKCFGAHGDVGGTVIDFLMHTKGFDKPQAVRYFKEELCGITPRTTESTIKRPDPEPIPEQYAHLFDADRNLLFDELTGDDFINCEAIYSKILELESSAEISTYIMRLKQAAKRFKLAGAVEERASAYKQEALRILRAERKAARREQTGQTERDLKDFPYITERETEQGDIFYTVNCPMLAEHIRQNCDYIITHDRFSDHDRMFWYEGGAYKPITDSILQGYIKGYITAFDLNILKMRDVLEVMKDLKTDMCFVSEEQLNDNEDIINFQNGLYSISKNRLLPHTPELYSTIQIPCNYDPESVDCPVFTRYLFELVSDDLKKANLLLEYMGACISNIYGFRTKKALFMYGKGNTGKSQAKALIEMMLSEENCAAGDLSNLEERFGTGMLYQKRLYGSGDMSFVSVQELKIFKNVTGGDDILLEFKGKNAFPYKFKGFLWFCANELPSFGGDRGEWVYDRIIPFECKNVIPKAKQDKHLLDKMFAEREAIINVYLIPALQRLIANGYNFTLPNNVLDDLESYRDKNSPVRTFYKECCIMRKEYTDGVTLATLYSAFKNWYYTNMNRSCTLSRKSFKKELAEYLGMPNPESLNVIRNDGTYIPVTLTKEARELYWQI